MTDLPDNASPEHANSAAPAYRAYFIGRNGRIQRSVSIMADNDVDAIAQTEALTRTDEIELWDRSRIVVKLPMKTER